MALVTNQSRRFVTLMTFNAIYLAHMGIVVIDIAAVGLSGELLVSASMALKAVIHLYLIIRCGFTVTSFARNLFGSVPIGQILREPLHKRWVICYN